MKVVKAGVLRGAKYIVKMDDDMCLSLGHLTKLVKSAKEPKYSYIANMIWDKKVRTIKYNAVHPNHWTKKRALLEQK